MSASRIVAGVSAAAFVVLAVLVSVRAGPLLSFDDRLSRTAYTAALMHPLWRAVMSAVTATGSTTFLIPATAVGCALLVARGRWRQAVFAATALAVTLGVRLLLVTVIARPRPVDRLAATSSYSFPSGHSTASAATALILVLVCRPLLTRRWSRALLYAGAGAWAFTVGLSRVALVVHWPTDVLGAWLFATAVVLTVGLLLCRAFRGKP